MRTNVLSPSRAGDVDAVFGRVSRREQREADLFFADLMGQPPAPDLRAPNGHRERPELPRVGRRLVAPAWQSLAIPGAQQEQDEEQVGADPRDVAVTDTMALLIADQAPLPVTREARTAVASDAGASDDYKAVCALVPATAENRLLIFFHGNNNYVTVAPTGDVPARIDPSRHSRVPRWARGTGAAGKPAAPIKYQLGALAEAQRRQAAPLLTELAVKDPVVLVPEDAERATGDFWSVPPRRQYGAANDGRPAGPGTTRLEGLVMECYDRLRRLPNPSGRTYLPDGMAHPASWVSNVRRLYLSGHSGGGKPLIECAGADMALVTPTSIMGTGGRAVDLWLFDCTYGFGTHNYVNFCTNWLNARLLAHRPDASRFVCVYRPGDRRSTEPEANELRRALAGVLHVDADSLLKRHDSSNMAAPSMTSEVIPALTSSPVVFIRTHVAHDDIPTLFTPLLLRTAAS